MTEGKVAGVRVPPLRRTARRWINDYPARLVRPKCRITARDIIVGSLPRSGRTWIRFFVAAYVSHRYRLGVRVDWDNFVTLTPGPLCNKESGLLDFPDGPDGRLIFSHERTDGRFFAGRKVVYITRNLLDVIVSHYFFHMYRGRPWYRDVDIQDFVRREFDLDEAVSRINYFSSQLDRATDVLILAYEDVLRERVEPMRRLVAFTRYGHDEAAFNAALADSEFGRMRELERTAGGVDEAGLHVREGRTGGYRDHLDDATVSFVRDVLDRKLTGRLRPLYLGSTCE